MLCLLQILRLRFGVRCFLGLTATATQETIENVSQHLELKDVTSDTVRGSLLPPNLNLSVSRDANKETVRLTDYICIQTYLVVCVILSLIEGAFILCRVSV